MSKQKKLRDKVKSTIQKKYNYNYTIISITDFTETNNYFRKLWKKQQN